MTEILTESFCERCGTRYTFESARPRVRLKGVKVLSRGLKNFVLSDETSMDEAMAAARSETDRELTSHQLDAFHKTFNFCMSCRQYTCPNCWNEVEARCLSCAPHLGHEVLPAPFPDLAVGGYPGTDQQGANGFNGANGTNGAGHSVELVGVAEIEAVRHDEEVDAAARLAALTAAAPAPAETEPVVEPEAATPEVGVEPAVVAEAVVADAVEPQLGEPVAADSVVEPLVAPRSAEPVDADPIVEPLAAAASAEPLVADGIVEPLVADDAPATPSWLAALAAGKAIDAATPEESRPAQSLDEKVSSQTAGLLSRFRPGQSLDQELDQYERERVAAETSAAPPPPVEAPIAPAVAASNEPVVSAEPEVAAPEPPVVDDVVAQPVWQMVAPDPGTESPTGEPVKPPFPAAATSTPPNAEPQWPTRPEWTGGGPATGLPFLGRPAAPQGGVEALWAESNREVVTTPASSSRTAGVVQPCVSCGLSLSATARFCRRCGTPQGS
jgi:hypothetical protein